MGVAAARPRPSEARVTSSAFPQEASESLGGNSKQPASARRIGAAADCSKNFDLSSRLLAGAADRGGRQDQRAHSAASDPGEAENEPTSMWASAPPASPIRLAPKILRAAALGQFECSRFLKAPACLLAGLLNRLLACVSSKLQWARAPGVGELIAKQLGAEMRL